MTREEFDAAVDRIAAEELQAAQARLIERVALLLARDEAERYAEQVVSDVLAGVGCTRH